MAVCCCSLAGTAACQYCQNNPIALGFITTRPMPIKALDSSRADYLRREIAIAREKASGADTAGQYVWAAHFEDRAEELERELKEVINNSKT